MQTLKSGVQPLMLMLLRISLGLLPFWWGMARITNPKMGISVQKKFYNGMFDSVDLQYYFGFFEMVIGVLIIVGLFRIIVVPLALCITVFSASMIWTALADPFGLYLPFKKIASVQHLFYPSVVCIFAAAVMLTFRKQDVLNLDTLFKRKSPMSGPHELATG